MQCNRPCKTSRRTAASENLIRRLSGSEIGNEPALPSKQPPDMGRLARRISRWTTNSLLTVMLLVIALGFGRQVLHWWHDDATPRGRLRKVSPHRRTGRRTHKSSPLAIRTGRSGGRSSADHRPMSRPCWRIFAARSSPMPRRAATRPMTPNRRAQAFGGRKAHRRRTGPLAALSMERGRSDCSRHAGCATTA